MFPLALQHTIVVMCWCVASFPSYMFATRFDPHFLANSAEIFKEGTFIFIIDVPSFKVGKL